MSDMSRFDEVYERGHVTIVRDGTCPVPGCDYESDDNNAFGKHASKAHKNAWESGELSRSKHGVTRVYISASARDARSFVPVSHARDLLDREAPAQTNPWEDLEGEDQVTFDALVTHAGMSEADAYESVTGETAPAAQTNPWEDLEGEDQVTFDALVTHAGMSEAEAYESVTGEPETRKADPGTAPGTYGFGDSFSYQWTDPETGDLHQSDIAHETPGTVVKLDERAYAIVGTDGNLYGRGSHPGSKKSRTGEGADAYTSEKGARWVLDNRGIPGPA